MKSATWFFLAFLLTAGAMAHAAPLNLVSNGSFELGPFGIGSFQGWRTTLGDSSTFVDSSGQTGLKYGQASDGLWAAYFGSTKAAGGAIIAQTLATTVNQQYVLTFDLANDNGGLPASNSFAALIAGLPIFSAANLPNQGYLHEQFSFIATNSATTLQFSASNDQSYAELDNVGVSAVNSVPEPSSLVLLLTGALFFACHTRAAKPSAEVL